MRAPQKIRGHSIPNTTLVVLSPSYKKKIREKSAVRAALHKLLGCYYYYCYHGVLPEGDNGNAVGTLGSDVTNRREFSGCSSVSLFSRRGQCSEAIVIATMDYI